MKFKFMCATGVAGVLFLLFLLIISLVMVEIRDDD